jgi:hypothetical protein
MCEVDIFAVCRNEEGRHVRCHREDRDITTLEKGGDFTFLEDTSFPKAEILDFCGNKDGDPPSVYINAQKEVFLKLHEHNWDTPPQY